MKTETALIVIILLIIGLYAMAFYAYRQIQPIIATGSKVNSLISSL